VPDTHDVSNGRGAALVQRQVGTTGLSYMAGAVGRSVGSTGALCAMVSTSARALQQEIPYTTEFPALLRVVGYITRRRIDEGYGLRQIDWDERFASCLQGHRSHHHTPPTLGQPGGPRHPGRLLEDLRFDDRTTRSTCLPARHRMVRPGGPAWRFHHYEHMMATPARDKQYLIGTVGHVKSRSPIVSTRHRSPVPRRTRHGRRHLASSTTAQGVDNGVGELDRVRLSSRRTPARRRALAHVDDEPRCLPRRGHVDAEAPRPRARRATTTTRWTRTHGHRRTPVPVEDVPLDQSANEARQDVICFTGIRSPGRSSCRAGHLVFFASTTRRHGLARQITDVDPSGVSRRVTQGCSRGLSNLAGAAERGNARPRARVRRGALADHTCSSRPLHARHDHQQRLPLVRAFHEPVWTGEAAGEPAWLATRCTSAATTRHGASCRSSSWSSLTGDLPPLRLSSRTCSAKS